MSSLTPFRFESKPIRVLSLNGAPWFIVADVLLAMEYADGSLSNIANKIAHVPDEWKGRHPIATPGGKQEVWCLSEAGLYFFVNRSDKPKALPFQKWVAGDVLPAIRQTGGYHAAPPPAARPETVTLTKDDYIDLLKARIGYLQATQRPKRTRRNLSADDKARIEALHAQGWAAAAIGQQVGRSPDTVATYLRARGGRPVTEG